MNLYEQEGVAPEITTANAEVNPFIKEKAMAENHSQILLGTLLINSMVFWFLIGGIISFCMRVWGNLDAEKGLYDIIMWTGYIICFVLIIVGVFILGGIKHPNYQMPETDEIKYGGFWRRLLAKVVDIFMNILIIPGMMNLYYWIKDGQTIGYKLLRMHMYGLDKNGHLTAPSGRQLLTYPLFKMINTVILGIGFFMILIHPKKRGLHNILWGTVVARV